MRLAEKLRLELGVGLLSISVLEDGGRRLRTLVNAGDLAPGYAREPLDEGYETDAFPTVAGLMRGRSYVFSAVEDSDISSAALAFSFRVACQAGAPIMVDGEVWGELWIGDRDASTAFDSTLLAALEAAAARAATALVADEA